MKRVAGLSFALFALSLTLTPAFAIVIRHDVPDSKYLEFATNVPSPVILFTNRLGSADGMGSWITPDWILTAAHVGEMIKVGDSIGIERELKVEAVTVHADWPDMPVDVALIKVSRATGDAKPVDVCPVTALEGETVVFVGAGDFGDGKTGPVSADGKMRAARNVISSVGE